MGHEIRESVGHIVHAIGRRRFPVRSDHVIAVEPRLSRELFGHGQR